MTITLTREEAQQVLDALDSKYIVNCGAWRVQRDAAIETLRAQIERSEVAREGPVREWARISQPEPEPVAWTVGGLITDFSRDFSAYKTKTYTRPLYTAPPQREWQGLTEEEMAAAWSESKGDVLQRLKPFARAIEAKLKEKNSERI